MSDDDIRVTVVELRHWVKLLVTGANDHREAPGACDQVSDLICAVLEDPNR